MEKIIHTLKDTWFIIIFIGGCIIWYANVSYRLTAIEAKAQEQNTALIELMKMKTDVEIIKVNVDFIKAKIK